MEKIFLSKDAFNLVIASLLDLEERKTEYLDSFFPLLTKERESMDDMITNYIQRMDDTLARISVVDSPRFNKFPFVVVGSNITVQDMESQSMSDFRLITPSEPTVKAGDISIFSPIGKALLLKENNLVVKYEAPGGVFCYKILSILLSSL